MSLDADESDDEFPEDLYDLLEEELEDDELYYDPEDYDYVRDPYESYDYDAYDEHDPRWDDYQ